MEIKIPKRLNIGGFDYEVIVRDNRVVQDGTSSRGSHSGKLQKIWIDTSPHRQQTESVLIHEILEAINDLYELELEHSRITVLGTTLYQVLKDNF